jgi:hypothetical protein
MRGEPPAPAAAPAPRPRPAPGEDLGAGVTARRWGATALRMMLQCQGRWVRRVGAGVGGDGGGPRRRSLPRVARPAWAPFCQRALPTADSDAGQGARRPLQHAWALAAAAAAAAATAPRTARQVHSRQRAAARPHAPPAASPALAACLETPAACCAPPGSPPSPSSPLPALHRSCTPTPTPTPTTAAAAEPRAPPARTSSARPPRRRSTSGCS